MSLKDEINQAISAHGQWKVKFRDFMDGKLDLDPNVVKQNNQCQFGKWLEGDGRKLMAKGDFDEIHRLHTEFHKAAGDVVVKKKAGDVAGAQAALGPSGAFTKASSELTRRMMAVKT